MASFPSSSDGTYPSSDSDAESSTTNYGHIDDEPAHITYQKGILTWEAAELKDEEIVAVTMVGAGNAYTILSLAPGVGEKHFELRTTRATLLPQAFLDRFLSENLPLYLQNEHVHVLISTLSGVGLSPSFFDEVLHPVLRAIGLADSRYSVVRTSSAKSVMEFASSTLLPTANCGQTQTVLMLSGDGGMVDTINGLMENGERSSFYVKPALAQLPLGTGNALFHSLHKLSTIPSIYIQGLRTLLHGTPKPLPIFSAKFSPGARLLTDEARVASLLRDNTLYGAVVASYGLHATLVADSDTTEYRKHGAARFPLVAKDLLYPDDGSNPHAYKADLVLDGKTIERKEHGYVLASLVSNLEKTFEISPASKPLDGKLRVVHFGALSGEGSMDIMKGAYANGKHVGMDGVGYESVDGMRIDFREEGETWRWRRCCVDGLIVGVEEGGWMQVDPVLDSKLVIDIVTNI